MNTISKFGIAASLVFLTACGGGGIPGVTDDSGCISGCDSAPVDVEIFAESSQTSNKGINPTATWTVCYAKNDSSGNPLSYNKEQIIIEYGRNPDNTSYDEISWTQKLYSKTDTSCIGTPISDFVIFDKYTATVLSQITISGWVDEAGTLSTAPQRSDATGSLTAQPKVTVLKVVNGTTTLGATLYIDDTSSPNKMYKLGKLTSDSSSDAYLSAANPLIKNRY